MELLCTEENIELADKRARKGKKSSKWAIEQHDLNKEAENKALADSFRDGSYHTSSYHVFKIYEPKEREIYRLPYYPDRIAHHAIMNVVRELWIGQFIHQTYSCIEGRGIHRCAKELRKCLYKHRNDGQTKYCLKFDIRKFYPSINHEILKSVLRRKIKDNRFLHLLYEIIDSIEGNKGVPIGNYLSQFFANLYLAYFDKWCKEELRCRHYFRFADDIVILAGNKEALHSVLICIKLYLKEVLDLELKPNWQIFPVESRGIDFVGYVFRHRSTRLRKGIKMNMFHLLNECENCRIGICRLLKGMASYKGWMKYCDAESLRSYVRNKMKVLILYEAILNFIIMNTKLNNNSDLITSLQVGVLKDVPAGNFNPGHYFLIKNITEDPYGVEIRPAGQKEFVTTVMYPGWNPEIVSEIKDAPDNVFQYGY